MKNYYEIVESGTRIPLEDEFQNVHYITVDRSTVIIYANGNHKENWKIIINEEDFNKVNETIEGRWYVSVCKGTIYAMFCKQTKGTREYFLMHRLIANCPINLVVDHDPHHYGLDNRRENLTNITANENNRNQVKDKTKNLFYNKTQKD